ncbi:MAG: SusC/RagA family TonB-linked outer membrane protein [Draconibacterium sp.]
MKKLTLLFVCVLIVGMQLISAQVSRISGTVTGAGDGATIPGVSVMIKGTTVGTVTNIDGYYQFDIPDNSQTVIFSFVGMRTREIPIEGKSSIDVQLQPDILGIDEVVIVGYGTATRQSFTGSATSVKSENIQNKSVANVSQSLAGEAAGVRVINTSGQPGSDATVRIRGFGSVNGNKNPLYVLDGVPYSGSLNAINPNDIESTTVLKDATATAIYGSRGANGVILLTTKSGRNGTSVIEADVKTGVNARSIPRYSTIKSPEDYISLCWEALYNKGATSGDPEAYANSNLFSSSGIDPKYNLWNVNGANLINPDTRTLYNGVTRKYNPENWEDYAFQNSSRTEANLTLGGGSETTKYFTSFGYLNDVGYIVNSNFKRYNATVNIETEVRKWLITTARLTYSGTETTNNGQTSDAGNIFWFVDNLPPIFPLFLRDGTGAYVADPIYGGNQYDYGIGRSFGALTNAIANAHYDLNQTKQNQLAGNFSANIKIVEGLNLETTFGGQFFSRKYTDLRNPFYGSAVGQGGSVYKEDTQLTSYNLLNLLRFRKSYGSHNIEALAAHESNSWERKVGTAQKSKMVHPDIDDLNNFVIVTAPPTSFTDKVNLESYFGQVNYDFSRKYYLSASIRRDGTSRFIGDNKWDNFGSIGASWILSEESFLNIVPLISYLKYKISFGLMGEQDGVGFYPAYTTMDVSNLNNEIALSEHHVGNPGLTWETSKMFQTGIELGLGKFIDASIDYYQKNTGNLLFDRGVGVSVGYPVLTVNDGVLRNSGLEFDITNHIFNSDDFVLDFSINGELLSNTLIRMPIDPATGEPKLIDVDGRFGRAEGHSLYDFYLREWAGVDPEDGKAMWYQSYYDQNENGVVDAGEGISSLYIYETENPDHKISTTTTKDYASATEKYVGKSAIPKLRGGFRLYTQILDFDLSAQFIYSLGGYGYDAAYALLMNNDAVGGNNWSTDIYGRWQKPGDITNVPRLSSNTDKNVISSSTRFLTKSDYLNLNNLKIGYTVPNDVTERVGISSLNVFISGDNLFLLSARNGFNPSTSETGTTSTYRYSPLSTYTVGLRVRF